jgi:hypothetical protein
MIRFSNGISVALHGPRACRPTGCRQTLLVAVLVGGPDVREGAGLFEILDEGVDVVDAPRGDIDGEHDAEVALDAGTHRQDAHLVGQRRLKAVEQLGPREGAPIDQVVGLPGVGGGEVDLPRIDAGAQARRLLAQIGRAGLVVRRLGCEAGVAARIAEDARHVERGRRQDDERQRDQPDPDQALVVERPRRKVRADHALTSA